MQDPADPADADDAQAGQMSPASATPQTPASWSAEDIAPAAAGSPSSSPAGQQSQTTHDPTSPENQKKKDWIAIKLLDKDGKPVPYEPYKVTLPDGTVKEGTLDGQGCAKVTGVDPGTCQVTFHKRDKSGWKPKE